jgi:hypothetical protein
MLDQVSRGGKALIDYGFTATDGGDSQQRGG